MTTEQTQKLSSIVRRACDVAKNSIDSFAQLADDALQVFADPNENQVSIATNRRRAAQPERRLFNKKQIAELLNVCPRTVSTLQTEGLPVVKIGTRILFDYEKVLLWIERDETESGQKTNLRVVK